MGAGVSRQTQAAAFPPDRFYCLLDEMPLHLIPKATRRLLSKVDDPQRSLYLNPQCTLTPSEQVPEEIADQSELLSGFALQGTMGWVRDGETGWLLPFWLGPRLEELVGSLTPHDPVPLSWPADARRVLAAAGVLVPEIHAFHEVSNDPCRRAAAHFKERLYAPIGGLIHPFHIAALRRYYRHLIRSGSVQLGDRQTSRRYAAYNEPVARFFHHQIAAKISAITGESLRPSYVYFASYLSGAELEKHIDREQCEYSVTFCLDFSPEPALATPWPIELDTPRGKVTVYQALGDGLVYRGTRVPHYRKPLGDGQTSTSIFFHYVAADFDGPVG